MFAEYRSSYVELLTDNVKKVITPLKEFECPWMARLLVKEVIVNSENKKIVQKTAGFTDGEQPLSIRCFG